jgi:hypothetical protein
VEGPALMGDILTRTLNSGLIVLELSQQTFNQYLSNKINALFDILLVLFGEAHV